MNQAMGAATTKALAIQKARERRRAAGEDDAHGGPCEEGHDPAVVTGEDRGDDTAAMRVWRRLVFAESWSMPVRHRLARACPDHFAEEERLGHGRGLEVKQIGIGGVEGEVSAAGRWEPGAARR